MKIYIKQSEDMIVKFINKDTKKSCDKLKNLMSNSFFKGENGETFLNLKHETPRLLVGLGNEKEMTVDSLKIAGKKAALKLNEMGLHSAHLSLEKPLDFCEKHFALAILEGFLNASYDFNKYKSEKKEFSLEEITIEPDRINLSQEEVNELNNKWEGIVFARNLVNTPANDMYPETLAEEAKSLDELGVKVKILDKKEIEKIGMEAYLSVARGSAKEPKFIIMEYMNGNGAPLVYVGKGLTYDSGGYSLKPSDGMKTMKSDMGGSAAVIGAMKAIALQKLNVNVVGIVAACENMLDGNAYKPGDVIGSLRGLSIEVDNTDAEGRLTLADAVCYGEREYQPKLLIDLATLTGACIVAVGEHRSGILGNSEEEIKFVLECAKKEDERAWPLPYGKDYQELNKSDIADIKNRGGRGAGASSAGEFVGAFIENSKWVHIDIAGPAYNSAEWKSEPKGATGHMVKTLYRIAKESK